MHGTDTEMEGSGRKRLAGILADRTLFSQLGFTIGVCVLMYFIASSISALMINKLYGMSGGEMITQVEQFLEVNLNNLNPYRFMQMMSTLLIFGVSSLIVNFLVTGSWLGYFRFEKRANMRSLTMIPPVMLFAFPVVMLIYSYTSLIPFPDELIQLEKNMEIFTTGLLGDGSWNIFLINFLMIAILPAVFEEFLFRGVFMKQLTGLTGNHHIGILLSGTLFGLIHGQVFAFLPIAALGILFGYLYWWTKNLLFPIFAHFFHNGIQVVAYFLAARGVINVDLESSEMLPPASTAVLTVLFVVVLYLFYTVNRKTADEPI